MRCLIYGVCFVLLAQQCRPLPATDEASVVSDYTGANCSRPLGVYQQIASNIAQRITNPLFRILGIGGNKTNDNRPDHAKGKIEILDDTLDDHTKAPVMPVDNDISDREVEELSSEALKKIEKKPEKITLYSSYLPSKLQVNDTANSTINEVDIDDDDFDLDDFDLDEEPKQSSPEGGLIWFLEVIGSLIQLLWGGFTAWIKPPKPDDA
ncbi:hypothetical protein JYU34_011743 [Plutella xylostella]|uniref:Uncharacterized protein n=1 Tax=Plutella xylostella TaxID=51655 RepID=A0ABQ7QDY8_PLUXY|nr:hypothetical protein JYU34_011743 [Plutella xylostella]